MNKRLRLGAVMSLGSLMALASVHGCRSNNQGMLPLGTGGGQAGATGTGGTTADDGFGEDCTSDVQCKEFGLLCDTNLGCVECVDVDDCPAPSEGEAACTAGRCGAIIPCENSLDCPGVLVCDETAGQCVECIGDADCSGGAACVQGSCVTPECTEAGDCDAGQTCVNNVCETVTTCETTADCTDQVCDTVAGQCVDCLTTGDCDANQTCTENQCVTNTGTCDKPRVIVLVQRSGGMFDNGWWGPLRTALGDTGGLIEQFSGTLDIGVQLFYREGTGTCPVIQEAALPAQASQVKTLMDQAETDWTNTTVKVDAPFPEAIAAAQADLSSAGNPPFIVLLNASVPDTCTIADNPCSIDPVVAAVQDANTAGIKTYVLGLADAYFTDQDYALQAIANAGLGYAVETLPASASEDACSQYFPSLAGTYAEQGGNATAYFAEDPSTLASGLQSIFTQIAQTCD